MGQRLQSLLLLFMIILSRELITLAGRTQLINKSETKVLPIHHKRLHIPPNTREGQGLHINRLHIKDNIIRKALHNGLHSIIITPITAPMFGSPLGQTLGGIDWGLEISKHP